MAFLVDQAAAKNFADFIDTVGELVAAVIDMNHGVAVQHIAAIDISYFAHAPARDFMGGEKVTLPSSAGPWRPRSPPHSANHSTRRHRCMAASCRLRWRTSSRILAHSPGPPRITAVRAGFCRRDFINVFINFGGSRSAFFWLW